MDHQYKVKEASAELYGAEMELLEKILQHPEEPIMGKKIYEGTTLYFRTVAHNISSVFVCLVFIKQYGENIFDLIGVSLKVHKALFTVILVTGYFFLW